MIGRVLIVACGVCLALSLVGCKKAVEVEPEYSRPLPPGTWGLRRITDPSARPDLQPVVRQLGDPSFQTALNRSLQWFRIPSTKKLFPSGPISHHHAHTSVFALSQIANQPSDVASRLLEGDFDIWESVGWDGSGEVLYTAYYSPQFRASLTPTGRFRYPLYKRPSDLESDPLTGEVLGRRAGGRLVPYPTRREIEASGMLRGLELVYLESPLDAYIVQVNGSAKLNMIDGRTMYVGYAGTNGLEYTSIGRLLVAEGVLKEHEVNLPSIRQYFTEHPEQLDAYVLQNDRFVFFREYDGSNWPAGSMGFRVEPMRSLATDKEIFPRGSVVLVDTTMPAAGAGTQAFRQLMLDQDTGGAIRAAGRADIYLGQGARAEDLAGRQAATGHLYYLLLKPDAVASWAQRQRATAAAAGR